MIEVQINKTNAVSFSELAPNLCRYHFAAKQHDHYFKRAPSIAFAIARTLLRNVFRKGQVQQIQVSFIFGEGNSLNFKNDSFLYIRCK